MITLIALSILGTTLAAVRIFARRRGDTRTFPERFVCGLFAVARWWFCAATAADRAVVEFRAARESVAGQRPACLEAPR